MTSKFQDQGRAAQVDCAYLGGGASQLFLGSFFFACGEKGKASMKEKRKKEKKQLKEKE
jgi:hypothetical protein